HGPAAKVTRAPRQTTLAAAEQGTSRSRLGTSSGSRLPGDRFSASPSDVYCRSLELQLCVFPGAPSTTRTPALRSAPRGFRLGLPPVPERVLCRGRPIAPARGKDLFSLNSRHRPAGRSSGAASGSALGSAHLRLLVWTRLAQLLRSFPAASPQLPRSFTRSFPAASRAASPQLHAQLHPSFPAASPQLHAQLPRSFPAASRAASRAASPQLPRSFSAASPQRSLGRTRADWTRGSAGPPGCSASAAVPYPLSGLWTPANSGKPAFNVYFRSSRRVLPRSPDHGPRPQSPRPRLRLPAGRAPRPRGSVAFHPRSRVPGSARAEESADRQPPPRHGSLVPAPASPARRLSAGARPAPESARCVPAPRRTNSNERTGAEGRPSPPPPSPVPQSVRFAPGARYLASSSHSENPLVPRRAPPT
uniref:Uncharacterized protein n=1 Tax=Mustela putorius furo TaxID=9669 RepID=M3Y3P3_MUSPF